MKLANYLKKLYIVILTLLIINYPLKGYCFNYLKDDTNYDNKEKTNNTNNNKINPNNYSQIKFDNFIKKLANNISQNEINSKNDFNYFDIISDKQLRTKDQFIGEGNVIVKNNNAILKADRLSYDLVTKKIILTGNILFKSDEQFFKSSKIEYNLDTKKGTIKDIYGTINFDKLDSLKFGENKNIDIDEKIDFNQNITDVRINKSSSLDLKDVTSPQDINLEINEMNKWRFQADEIKIDKNIWSSNLLFLTNDPFNKPQLVIKNSNFKSINLDNEIILKTKWSTVILDDAIKIPIGPRNYKKNSNNLKWGIGYDENNKDGIYLTRYPKDIYFGNGKGILKLKNEFYLERILSGKTKSFSDENASVLAKSLEQESKISDYFGLGIDLNTSFKDWYLNSEINLNSLDLDKFKKIATINSEFSKVIFLKEDLNSKKEVGLSIFGIYREKVWNGSLGESDILLAYGVKAKSEHSWVSNNLEQSSKLALGYGEYQANKKLDKETSISRKRLNISLERDFKLPIWDPEKKDFINEEFKFSPTIIDIGLDLYVSAKADLYTYEDGNYQNLLSFKAGPKIILGDFKKKYFDYTEFNILGRTTIASGESPFDFDQSVDNHAIEIEIKQQLIGPFVLGYSTDYNLDINSSNFKQFTQQEYELSINRRGYNLGLFYDEQRKRGGINFEINSFNFNGFGSKFK